MTQAADEREESRRRWIARQRPLRVEVQPSELLDRVGMHPTDDYVEAYWLPLIGPTTVWMLRRLVRWLEDEPDGYYVDLRMLSMELGIGQMTDERSGVVRTLSRLVGWHFAQPSAGAYRLLLRVPPVPRHNLRTLPPWLRERATATRGEHFSTARLERPPDNRPVLALGSGQ